jgi:DNA-binding transcriptional ArsR family regulator
VPRDAGHRHVHPQAAAPQPGPAWKTDEPDPLIHVPARLKIVATPAALPDGDALSFTRQQDMIGLTPGNLPIHLRKLEDAGYLTSENTGNGAASRTTLALTRQGPHRARLLHRRAAGPPRRPLSRYQSRRVGRPVLGSLRTRTGTTASDLAHRRTPTQPPPL